jgi:hypothetical protein
VNVKEMIEALLQYPMTARIGTESTQYDRCGDSYYELDTDLELVPKRVSEDAEGRLASFDSYDAKPDEENPNVIVIE